MTDASHGKRDFFISFNRADRDWATWIAWVLEEAGYSVIFQDWDFRGSFMEQMNQAILRAERVLVVLSDYYLRSEFTRSEAWAAMAGDPVGREDHVVPIKVGPAEDLGLFSHFAYLDLTVSAEADAERRLLERAKQSLDPAYRPKPATRPPFPGQAAPKPRFPAPAAGPVLAVHNLPQLPEPPASGDIIVDLSTAKTEARKAQLQAELRSIEAKNAASEARSAAEKARQTSESAKKAAAKARNSEKIAISASDENFKEIKYGRDKYIGQVRDEEASGFGVLYRADGDRYEGEWQEDQASGNGIYFFAKNSQYDRYEGELSEMNADGFGVWFYVNGDRYEGQLRGDKFEGYGILFYNNNNRYEGKWNRDQRQGVGVYIYADDDEGRPHRYEGDWQNVSSGYGVMFFKSGNIYKGHWKNDTMTGYGVYHYANGDRYEGQLEDDYERGYGAMYYIKRRIREGKWQDDELVEEFWKLFS